MLPSFIISLFVVNITFNLVSAVVNLKPPKNSIKLPPCKACKIFVESFKRGLDRTSKFKFEGGDTAWEEEKLGRYSTSEVRYVEIHEHLCSEVIDGSEQCYNLLEEYDETLEEWWFKKQTEEPDLFKYLCIDIFTVCCPDHHFGKNCSVCPGYPDNICHNNGKCKGSGTRKGDGQCRCDKGYDGDFCDKCGKSYYVSYRDDKKLLCSECHNACDGSCIKAGVAGCTKCKSGWIIDKDKGCLDINECAAPNSICAPLQFCVNTEGSFKCLDCDKSCAGCTGDGPDMCTNCASGFIRKDNICVDSSEENRKQFVFFSRYLTYMGMCIATCIIFNKNTYLAAIVGSCVAIYITVSEYTLNSVPTPKMDLENQVVEQVMDALN